VLPKYLPYIDEALYYVVGVDPPVRDFPYRVNPQFATLDSCQVKQLNYELKMRDDVALPHFIALHSKNHTFQIVNPVVSDKGTYFL
jgi:hypothetical protein